MSVRIQVLLRLLALTMVLVGAFMTEPNLWKISIYIGSILYGYVIGRTE